MLLPVAATSAREVSHVTSLRYYVFLTFFLEEGGDGAPSPGGGGGGPAWYEVESELAGRLLAAARAADGGDRANWVKRLRAIFGRLDADGTGALSRSEFARCLQAIGMDDLSRADAAGLIAVLDTNGDGRVSYAELVSFLLKRTTEWHTKEKAVAEKVLKAMGGTPSGRRRWIAEVKRALVGIDRHRTGAMSGAELCDVLVEHGVRLTRQEEARLVRALGGGADDGGVSYGDLMKFCAQHAGRA